MPTTDSTNNYARGLLRAAGLTERQPTGLHGTAVFVHEQVAGRGQRGKSWASEKGTSLSLSLILEKIPLPVSNQFALSAAMALATRDFLAEIAGDECRIKWPNDLYWQDRKAGGMLIEAGVRSERRGARGEFEARGEGQGASLEPGALSREQAIWDWAVVGIGINVNQERFPAELPNPVSLRQITGKVREPLELAQGLHRALVRAYDELLAKGFAPVLERYNQWLYKKDQPVRFRENGREFTAVVKGVNENGFLLLEGAEKTTYAWGGLEWCL